MYKFCNKIGTENAKVEPVGSPAHPQRRAVKKREAHPSIGAKRVTSKWVTSAPA